MLGGAWLLCLLLVGVVAGEEAIHTNEFAVELDGDDLVADLVANTHGFHGIRKIEGLKNFYVFSHPSVAHRSKRSAPDLVEKLRKDPNVKMVEQQRLLVREKRASIPEEIEDKNIEKRTIVHDKQYELPINYYKDKSVYQFFDPRDTQSNFSRKDLDERSGCMDMFPDPFYKYQWYLCNEGQTGDERGLDTGAFKVWKKGITGKGVVVTILDDGIEHTHPDLKDNYFAEASRDFNGHDNDPFPNEKNSGNSHGTRCAGEVAAKAGNDVCGVGIAYESKIAGVRMLDGPITDAMEGEAIIYKKELVDVYSASWGPTDNAKTMEGPGPVCEKAFETGTNEGRGGKGNIFVWATGNGGQYGDTCGADGYVSNIRTLSVGCINSEGRSTYFSERCPATFASIYTGGTSSAPTDNDYRSPKLKVTTTDTRGDCTEDFQGTSAAAPLMAGVVALVLQANPELTWRDMQHVVVVTARIPNAVEGDWTINGAGFHVNPRFGFGAVDSAMMVEYAQQWTNVPEQRSCVLDRVKSGRKVPEKGHIAEKVNVVRSCSSGHDEINHLEHVVINVKASSTRRGDVNLILTSPSGTKSEILSPREPDDTKQGIDFNFMTVHSWGESPQGEWTLTVKDASPDTRDTTMSLESFQITFYGTKEKPIYPDDRENNKGQQNVNGGSNGKHGKNQQKGGNGNNVESHTPSKGEIVKTMSDEKEESDTLEIAKAEVLGWAMRMLKRDKTDELLDEDNWKIIERILGAEDEESHVHKKRKNNAEEKWERQVESPNVHSQKRNQKRQEVTEADDEEDIDQELDRLIRVLENLLEKKRK